MAASSIFLLRACIAALAAIVGGNAAGATEGGGSLYPLGVGTVLQGVLVPPPGFNLTGYSFYYFANRMNDAHGKSAVPRFEFDVGAFALRLDYAFPEPLWGIRFGVYAVVPLVRARLAAGNPPARFTGTKDGFGDFNFAPLNTGWEYDTPLGHVNQSARLAIYVPTADFRATQHINLGRGYAGYVLSQGNSLFPTENTHLGFLVNGVFNQRNPTTNYQSGGELDVDFSAGYDFDRDISFDINGYVYKQITSDYLGKTLVNGNGNKGQAVGIGPQIRIKLHPGAITIKWQTEAAVLNRPRGNRIWLQFYHPL